MDHAYTRLLRNSLVALCITAAAVAVCYFYVDRPVAWFVHDHHLADFRVLKWLTYPPGIAETWAPALLAILAVRRAWGPWHRWELTLVAALVALIVAEAFKDALQYLAGRDWPETWIDDNPSLIRDGAYGFHLWQGGNRLGSFPSGHTTRTLAVVAVYFIAYPRFRWFGALAAMAVAVGLVGMNYHFVSDVLAGGALGTIVGAYTARLCGLTPSNRPAP